MIGAFISLILLSTVLVTASTKGWWFGLNKNNGEHVAARIQVNQLAILWIHNIISHTIHVIC